jgi:hypothetical protein
MKFAGIRSIKTRLYKHMSESGRNKWTHVLQTIVHSLNRLPKHALGMRRPSSITRDHPLSPPSSPLAAADALSSGQRSSSSSRRRHKFISKLGDRVRVRIDAPRIGHKGYEARFSRPVYVIRVRIEHANVPCYRLRTLGGGHIQGLFYHSELTFAVDVKK